MSGPSPGMPPAPPTQGSGGSRNTDLASFVHLPGLGGLRVSDISGWWWVEEEGELVLDIGLRSMKCFTIADPDKAKEAEVILIAALVSP